MAISVPACLHLHLASENLRCKVSAFLKGMVTLQYSRICPTQFEPKLQGKLLQLPAARIPLYFEGDPSDVLVYLTEFLQFTQSDQAQAVLS